MSSTSVSNPRRRNASAAPPTGLNTMGLLKSATFHSPTSPTSSSNDTFVPPVLGRSHTNLEDVVDAHKRRMSMIVKDFDQSLNLDDSPQDRPNTKRRTFRDESLPVPRGFLEPPTVDPAQEKNKKDMERRSLRLRQRRSSRNNHESDSGLGSSLASTTNDKQSASTTSKETKASAITRSAANSSSSTMEKLPGLGSKARSRIQEHILRPLRAKPSLKDFEPIVMDVPRRIRDKEIVCLRDLEKTLIFMAPVSQLAHDTSVWGDAYRTLIKERTKTAGLYLDFCLTSIRCIQATVEYINERDQIRPTDRPYTNGYFVDLVDQIRQYAGQLANAKELGPDGEEMNLDQYVNPSALSAPSGANPLLSTDEVKLFGGFHENGRPAELVRIRKDGKAISMATGLPVDLEDEETKGPIQLKRSLSQQLEDEEEIMRSMARRKKNPTPEELAPKKCREPGCTKEFKRPCDLTKHEKTHSRPWKCPVKTCRYHEYGWPTEKEMDRHHNDKHSSAPPMYECHFTPCPYKSKRESNCKQHMEKAHGWTYVRTKTNNGKKPSSKAGSSTQPTPQLGNMPTPSSNQSIATPPEEFNSTFAPFGGQDGAQDISYPALMSEEEFAETFLSGMNQQHAVMDDPILGMSPEDQSTPSTSSSYGQYGNYQDGPEFTVDEDIYAAHAQLPQTAWPTADPKFMAQLQHQHQHQQQQQQQQHQMLQYNLENMHPQQSSHISPIGEGNAMLFTPNSLAEVDEGFEDLPVGGGGDFQLFSSNGMSKDEHFDPLFEVPSNGLGFSQPTSQDMFHNMGWDNGMGYQDFSQ